MRSHFALLLIGPALLVSGCRSSIPEQPIGRSAPAPVVSAAPAGGGLWLYRPATQRRTVSLDQQAVVEVRQDTLTRADSVSLHADVAFTMFAGTNRVTGTVSAYRVQSGAAAAATPPGLGVPFPFAGDFPAHGKQLELTQPSSQSACASPANGAVQSLRDLWLQPPDTLRLGTVWDDSSAYVLCRDGIPLRTVNHRQFRVTGAAEQDGRQVLTVIRNARGTLSGDGAQSGEPVSITGTSSGEMTYQLAPSTGELLSARGTSVLDFTLTSRVRMQRVRQRSRMVIVPVTAK
jgi:hypothetical protein